MPISQSGYAYRFSPQTLGQPEEEPVQAQQDIFDLPLSQELANVRGLTENYYNSYGRIKDFVNHAWKQYGVDVTKPNFSQQGGGDLYKAYQNMEAELMMTASDLKQHKKQEEERAKLYQEGKFQYAPGYDPMSPESVNMNPQQRGYSTELLPHVDEAINRLSVMYSTEGKATEATEKYRKNAENQIDQMVQRGMISPEQADYNKKAMFNAMAQTPYQLDVAAMKAQQDKQKRLQGAESIYKMGRKFNSDMSGYWSPERVEYKTVDGQSVATIRPETALSFGFQNITDPKGNVKKIEKILDYYYQDKQGRVFAKFDNPLVPDERVDNKSADEKVRTIYENNPKIGDAAKWSQAGETLRTEYGSVDESSLYDEPEMESLVKNRDSVIGAVTAKDAFLRDTRNKLISDIASNTDISFEIGGGKYKFKPHKLGSGFYLTREEFKNLTGKTPKSTSEYEHLDVDKIISMLEGAKFFDVALNEPTSKPKSKWLP